MSNSESDLDDMSCTPPDILKLAASATENLLPNKSKGKYDAVYKSFMDWQLAQKTSSFSENVILVYFVELAKKYKSSSLWAYYSMLKSTLNIYHSIHLETYMKLQAFLKRQSEGHQPKKSKTFTPEEISKFIKEAPDHTYLMTKVTLIMGLMGACRSNELYSMKTEDIEDYNGALIVKIPFTKTKIPRSFTVSGEFYDICKKYINLRPSHAKCLSLFLNYQNGKCTIQRVGINKLASMGKHIATFLKLKNPELYTGHSFRRSSATICVSAGGNITAVKQLGGWKSTTVAEGYIDDNITNKIKRGNQISNEINKHTSSNYNEKPCTSSSASPSPMIFNQTQMADKVIPGMNFNNCNVTINNYYVSK